MHQFQHVIQIRSTENFSIHIPSDLRPSQLALEKYLHISKGQNNEYLHVCRTCQLYDIAEAKQQTRKKINHTMTHQQYYTYSLTCMYMHQLIYIIIRSVLSQSNGQQIGNSYLSPLLRRRFLILYYKNNFLFNSSNKPNQINSNHSHSHSVGF